MTSKSKTSRLEQKSFWEDKLQQRLKELEEKGLSPKEAAKDTTIHSFRAKLRETNKRLEAIEAKEEKVEEMGKLKAEKLAAPKKEKSKKGKQAKGEDSPAESKRQQKKKKKQAAKKNEDKK
ncbi:MAG: hypothetical protein P8165_02300 [Deltaproteobacteria bacterium]|jgi:hypothetical protein